MKKALMTASLILMTSLAQAATVAIVNGEKVDGSEVDTYAKLLKSIPELAKAPEGEIEKMAFAKLVEDVVITKESGKRGLDKSSDFTKTVAEMEADVKSKGLDKQPDYKIRLEMTKKEILRTLLLQDIFNKTKVDDSTVKQMLDAHNKAYAGSKFYHFQRIGMQKADDVKKAYAELKKKTDFAEVKAKYGVLGDPKDQKFILNSKDMQMDPTNAKLGEELAKIKTGTYNTKAFEMDNFQFIFHMDKVEDFKPATLEKDKAVFEEQAKMMNTQIAVASLIRDAKIEVKDDKYKFYTEAMEELKKQQGK